MLAALPASGNFQLNSYGFGTGGTAGTSSSNYSINGIAGDMAGSTSSSNFKIGGGETFAKQADAPTVAIANNAQWYNKLLLTIGPEGNPSDALFAVAISTDNFATTQYVKSDLTVGSSLTLADYQTYAAFGSGSGVMIRGLITGSVYTVKAKAYRGHYTESGYGPTASSATTSNPQLSFDINVSAADTVTTPPYVASFGNLLPSSVVDAPLPVWINFASNAESGGNVYLTGQNAGLRSATSSYTIASQSGDISALAEGFGAQVASVTQTSGGPLTASAPYNGSGSIIGIADAVYRTIITTTSPIIGGQSSVTLMAKSQATTPSSSDYSELLTLVAAANF
jgi:hypothetical protein